MRMKYLTTLALGAVAFLIAAALPVQAGPPQNAEGLWQYTPEILDVREAGCNTFLTTFEDGVWAGTFQGVSTEDGSVVIHCSGKWSFNAIVNFSTVEVDGRTGTLVMSVNGKRPDGESDWFGRWVILSGTGDLDALRGQGTWWGPGAPAPGEQGDIHYEGSIHFAPS